MYAAIRLVSVAVAYLMTLWPLGGGSTGQESIAHDQSRNRFKKRDLPNESAEDEGMVLVPIVRLRIKFSRMFRGCTLLQEAFANVNVTTA